MDRIEMEERTIKFVLQNIYDNLDLSTPNYCAEVTSAEMAAQLSDSLPLIYLWNEDLNTGSFLLSINGALLAYLIEALIPRSDESFTTVLDSVTAILSASTRHSIVAACEKSGLPPSVVFSGRQR